MILFNRDLLFVHNPKTAGTSMLHYLGEILPPPVHRAGVKEIGTNHPSLPQALDYACAVADRRPGDFVRIIATVRNPFDREISMYRYFHDVLCRSPTVSRDLNDAAIEGAVGMAGRLDFSDYLAWVWRQFGTCDIWRSRCFYRTAQGRAPDNLRVIRTEHIEADLAAALAGIAGLKNASFPRLNVSDRTAGEPGFTDHTRSLVAQSYRWMVEDGIYPMESNRAAAHSSQSARREANATARRPSPRWSAPKS